VLTFEREYWRTGKRCLAGVDEAGRGPLAGPVAAAAVVMPPEFAERELVGALKKLNDSKKLTPAAREKFYRYFLDTPEIEVGVCLVENDEIDRINILQATHVAMARALASLPSPPDHALVDGLPVAGLPCSSSAIVKGDSKSLLIAAASVVAKVVRDHRMIEWDRTYPQYGFAGHKGYGTAKHIQALFEYGPCPFHRRSFRPVREAEAISGLRDEGHTRD
jgi:ribonuclease HII